MLEPTRSVVVPTAVSIILLLAAGVLAVVSGLPLAGAASAPDVQVSRPPPPPAPDAAPPTAVDIAAIGVSAPIDALGLTEKGELAVPQEFERVGWWSSGSSPGQPGPAVLVGHVDSQSGPAVFFELGQLRPGEEIVVRRADGVVTRFVVERTASYAKDRFPTLEVYGPTDDATLRLITCGGHFDRRLGHYEENLVVYARMRS